MKEGKGQEGAEVSKASDAAGVEAEVKAVDEPERVEVGEGAAADADADATGSKAGTEGVDIGGLLTQLEAMTAEAQQSKERYIRTVAELENYRKRAVREREDARRSANIGLVEGLVPVLDNFKLGLESAKQHEGGAVFAEGFSMILTQLEGVLRDNGVEAINPVGEAFDPNYHEAVGHVPSETVAAEHVVEVHRVGYQLSGRLIRAATVVVSSGSSASEN